MKRLACLMIVAVLAACGSDNTGPSDKFGGTWKGIVSVAPDTADTLTWLFTSTQAGSSVTGTVAVTSTNGDSENFTLAGTSTPPNLNLVLSVGGVAQYTYAGAYITSDSISGVLTASGVLGLDLKKQ